MLKTLTVWNFALLEQVEIEFDAGLNILTGETGALGAVLGHRLSGDVIRTGCEWSRVEAIFDIAGEEKLHAFLREQAIADEDDALIVTRQLTVKGKNVILVNGCHVTLAVLRKIGEYLADIHGQNENLALLKAENQFHLLDGSRPESTRLAAAYGAAFTAWQEAAAALSAKEEQARDIADRLDMLRWQVQEIESAQLTEKEDEGLEAEIKRLSNAERITESIEEARVLLVRWLGCGRHWKLWPAMTTACLPPCLCWKMLSANCRKLPIPSEDIGTDWNLIRHGWMRCKAVWTPLTSCVENTGAV